MNVKVAKKLRSEARDYFDVNQKEIIAKAIIKELMAGGLWNHFKFCFMVLFKTDLRGKVKG